MKRKILLTLAAALTVTTTLSAESIKSKYISAGAGTGSVSGSDVSATNGTEYLLSYGVKWEYDNGIVTGVDSELNLVTLDSESIEADNTSLNGMFFSLRAGYKWKRATAYGFGTAGVQELGSYGFGGGVGLEYNLYKGLSVGGEYRMVSMVETTTTPGYDYESTRGFLRYYY